MGGRKKSIEDLAANVFAEILLRIIYFLMGLLAPPAVLLCHGRRSLFRTLFSQPEALVGLLVVSLMVFVHEPLPS